METDTLLFIVHFFLFLSAIPAPLRLLKTLLRIEALLFWSPHKRLATLLVFYTDAHDFFSL